MTDQPVSPSETKQSHRILLRAFVVMFCILAGFFIPLAGIPMMLTMIFLSYISSPSIQRLIKSSMILVVVGVILLLMASGSLIGFAALFLPYVAAPLLAITACIIQFREKLRCGRLVYIFFFVLLLGTSLINARTYIIWVSPFIFMPPAINRENYEVYKECVKYVRNHQDMKDYEFYGGIELTHEKEPNESEESYVAYMNKLIKTSREPATHILASQLKLIMCPKFQRCDDVVIFFKGNSPFLPMIAKEIWHAWPSCHGVAYSLDGEDPNQSEDPIVDKYKPFVKIRGNWYMSRGLLMLGNGRNYRSIGPISKTLIDRSLSLDGIDPNELDESI